MSGPGTNTGHGHVWARPDGVRARCGGPGVCVECSQDQARYGVKPSPAAERVNAYLDTVKRMEPDIAMVDKDAALASIAISLKRAADSLERHEQLALQQNELLSQIEMSIRK